MTKKMMTYFYSSIANLWHPTTSYSNLWSSLENMIHRLHQNRKGIWCTVYSCIYWRMNARTRISLFQDSINTALLGILLLERLLLYSHTQHTTVISWKDTWRRQSALWANHCTHISRAAGSWSRCQLGRIRWWKERDSGNHFWRRRYIFTYATIQIDPDKIKRHK